MNLYIYWVYEMLIIINHNLWLGFLMGVFVYVCMVHCLHVCNACTCMCVCVCVCVCALCPH